MSPVRTVSMPLRWALIALAAALSACASVDLGPRYDPPPVRMPQPLPPMGAPAPATGLPQTQPVSPGQPVPIPLPPIGQTPPPVVPTPVQPAPPPVSDARAHLVTFSGRIDSGSVLPSTRSAGSGQIDAIYDPNTRLFRWIAQWSGLSGAITAVRFHGPADEAQVAPATLLWPAPFGPRYEGRATLTPDQAVDLLGGRWYVNVSTTSYPAGEIRGQLRVVH